MRVHVTHRGLAILLAGSSLIVLSSPASAQDAPVTTPAADTTAPGEITVTAQKRIERSIDVPTSITSLSGAKLEAAHVNQLTDLVGTVPGLAISNYGGPGMNTIQLRGLAGSFLDDFAGPLVATYIDNLPVGSSTAAGRGNLFTLDLQPYDMQSVEILRGPQGTLYGANSMGGLIKYTLKKPDLDKFEGRAGANLGYTNGAGGLAWSPRAAVNVPIVEDHLAVRVSGFYSKTPGYIDDVGTGRKNANSSRSYGGRAALLWKPTSRLSFQANALYQKSSAADVATVLITPTTPPGQPSPMTPVYGDQKTYTNLPNPITQRTADFTFGANYDFGFATLSTTAGWVRMNTLLNQDLTEAYAALNPATDGKTRFGLASHLRKFTEETRLTSSTHGGLEYTLGMYYTSEHAGEDTNFQALESDLTPIPDFTLLQGSSAYVYREVAGFANATYKFSRKFDISAGGRYTSYSQKGEATSRGELATAPQPADTGDVHVGVWSVNARYHFNPNFMVYARFATGYRPGAFNSPSSSCPIPASSDPDRTDNYEAGVKGSVLDRRLNFELTGYHIKWKNMQLNVSVPYQDQTCIYVTNGGSATSNGIEASTGFQLLPELRLGGTLTYEDAHLDEDIPLNGGRDGDRLPLSSKWQFSATADWVKPVSNTLKLLAGASYSYKGSYNNFFEGTGAAYPFKPMKMAGVYVGGELGGMTARLSLQNMFNNHSYVGLQYPFRPTFGYRAVPVLPRTVSLSLDYKF